MARHARGERWVARLVVVGLVAWALSGLVADRVGHPEPYPTPLMPGFGSAPSLSDVFYWTSIEVEVTSRGGDVHHLAGAEVLRDVKVAATAVYRSVFFDGVDLGSYRAEPVGVWRRVTSGLPTGRTSGGEPRASHPATKEWLRARVVTLVPGVDPVAVTVYQQRWVTHREDRTHSALDERGLSVRIDLELVP